MASLSQRIKVELDNISQVLTEIERIKGKEKKRKEKKRKQSNR